MQATPVVPAEGGRPASSFLRKRWYMTGELTEQIELLELNIQMAGCKNRCKYCFSGDEPPMKDLMSYKTIQYVLDSFRPLGSGEYPRVKQLIPFLYAETLAHSRCSEILQLLGEGRGFSLNHISTYSTNGWSIAHSTQPDELFIQLRVAGCKVIHFSLFGHEPKHDCCAGRKGAFNDTLTATKRAVDAGFVVHWNYAAFTDTITHIPDLMSLYHTIVPTSLSAQGVVFVPSFHGRAINLEHIRPTRTEIDILPDEIRGMLVPHLRSEREWRSIALDDNDGVADFAAIESPGCVLLFIDHDLRVFPSQAQGWPQDIQIDLQIGSLLTDSVETIIDRYPAMSESSIIKRHSGGIRELAAVYGNPDSEKLYWPNDIVRKWFRMHLLKTMKRSS